MDGVEDDRRSGGGNRDAVVERRRNDIEVRERQAC